MKRQKREQRCYSIFNPSRLVLIFVVTSLVGNLMETLFCGWITGEWGSRQGVLYGPFSPIYGAGAVLMLITFPLSHRSFLLHAGVGGILGGGFEVLCSLLQSEVFGSASWNYAYMEMGIPLFGGRTSVLFMVLWGLATVFWVRWGYPKLNRLLSKLPLRAMQVTALLAAVFMAANITVSGLALKRWSERLEEHPADSRLAVFLDRHYPDSRMRDVFSNMMFL